MPLSTLKKLIAPLSPQNLAAGMTRDVLWDRPVFRAPALPNPRAIFDPQPFTTQRPLLKRAPAAERKGLQVAARESEPTGIRRWLFSTHRQRPLHGQGQLV